MTAIAQSFFQRVEKLRRCASRAAVANRISTPPLILPPAWVALTAVTKGNIRSNGGGWFMCVTSGTTAASGGPLATTSGTSIVDGTAAWTYLGGPTSTANAPQVPTLSTSTTTALTNFWGKTFYQGCYRLLGANIAGAFGGGNIYEFYSGFNYLSGQASFSTNELAIEFMVDDPIFDIGFTNGSPMFTRISVDDVFLTTDQYGPIAGGSSPAYVRLDYSANSQRKARRVRVVGPNGTFNFYGVVTSANGQVWAPPVHDSVRAVFVSDSLFAGSNSGPFVIGGSAAQRVGALLGWDDVWDMSQGSTGYIANASGGGYTYGQRVADVGNAATIASADVVVLMGSTNDNGQSGATITAAAKAAFTSIRATNPTCLIIVLGVWSSAAASSATETAVMAAVTSFNDPRTFFVPISNDPVVPWVTGAWNNSGNTSSTNAGMYISNDGTHPPDVGTAYLGERIARAIRTSVLPVAA